MSVADDQDFDPIEVLRSGHGMTGMAVHNVQLLAVEPGDGGRERLTVLFAGKTYELSGGGRWSPEWSRRDVGRFGHLLAAESPLYAVDPLPMGAVYFRAYVEPSLRRVPEYDTKGLYGWRCDGRAGFQAPHNVIPGEGGQFVRDETVEVTVRVPPEFVRECERVQMTPKDLLEGFVADAAGIQNFVARPRADGLGSNGSDEREMASVWIERAYGMNAIDLDELDARREEQEEREWRRDDITGLLDEFVDYGGQADALLKAVQALVDEQRTKNDADQAGSAETDQR